MLRFRLLGVPFLVAPVFWIVGVVLGLDVAWGPVDGLLLLVVWVACVFASVVVHELGHALLARRYGLRPAVLLAGAGGLTSYAGGGLTRGRQIAVALAGPAAGFAFYLLVRLLPEPSGAFASDALPGPGVLLWAATLNFLAYINFVWTLLNLLPILPLDGGQVLRDALGPRGSGTARLISIAVAGIIALLSLVHGQVFRALLFGYLAYANYQGNLRALPGGVDRQGPR